MSTKALKTQLFAAIAMVLVAAIALGSSTYAWFAQNTVVTAESVDVTAQTAKNLSIANTKNGDYSTSITLATSSGGAMWPVMATNNAGGTYTHIGNTAQSNLATSDSAVFFIINSQNKVLSGDNYVASTPAATSLLTGVTGTDTNDGAFTTSGAAANFWTEDCWLRYDYTDGQSTAIDAKVIVSLNTTATAISSTAAAIVDAYHVALVCDAADDTVYVWNMGQIADGTYNKDGSANLSNNAETGILEATITVSNLFTALPANDPRMVRLYIWYEGEDQDCYSTASLDPTLLTTKFEFKIHE